MSAIEIIRRQQRIAIVILTNFNEDEMMVKGLSAGRKGFLLKDTDRETLLHTIRAAARAKPFSSPNHGTADEPHKSSDDQSTRTDDHVLTAENWKYCGDRTGGAQQRNRLGAGYLGAHGEGSHRQHLLAPGRRFAGLGHRCGAQLGLLDQR